MSLPAGSPEKGPQTRVLRAVSQPERPDAGQGGIGGTTGAVHELSRGLPCGADLERDDLTGWTVESYELGAKIGGGGMGAVFLARHVHLGRTFAIKFVTAAMAGSQEAQQRFEQETRALGRLAHPRIVNAVDAGVINGLRYLVTEFIEGDDLQRLVARSGPLPYPRACELIAAAAEGLGHAHAAGFVHRDIKPSNLIIDPVAGVKILDFGLVREAGQASELTADHALLGTWDYMAPEQAEDAGAADARSDIYSLGGTLLFLLSGAAPFSGAKYRQGAAKLKGHLLKTPEWLESPPATVPAELVAVVRRMLAKSPDERFATAEEVVAALTPFVKSGGSLSGEAKAPLSRRMGAVRTTAAAAVMAGGLAYGGWMLIPADPESQQAGQRIAERGRPSLSSGEPPVLPPRQDVDRSGTTAIESGGAPAAVQSDAEAAAPGTDASDAAEAVTTDETAGTTWAEEQVVNPELDPVDPPAVAEPLPDAKPPVAPARVTVTPQRTNSAVPFTLAPRPAVTGEALGKRGTGRIRNHPQD